MGPLVGAGPGLDLDRGLDLFGRAVGGRHAPPTDKHAPRRGAVGIFLSGDDAGLGQTEVRDFRNHPVHHHVVGLHILVNQMLLVGIFQAPGKLDRDVQNPPQALFRTPAVENPAGDPVVEAAVFHKLGEDHRNAANPADVVAAHNVRVQPQLDPGGALALKIVLAALRLKSLSLRSLQSQVKVPTAVPGPVDQPHPPFGVVFPLVKPRLQRLDLVDPQDHVANVPNLG